jgi:glycosidase
MQETPYKPIHIPEDMKYHRMALPLLAAASGLITSGASLKVADQTAVVHPEWSRKAVIYEVNLRQYTPEGTFRAFQAHLPRLKAMGTEILWLMPINPIGTEQRKGSLGSYYSVKDYLAVNPEFGTKEDLKTLVAAAHRLGMKVIIDWVANHTSWDNALVKEHPDWYQHDSAGNIVPPVKDWTDVAALNYDNPGLRKYMTDALIYWVKEADIDGYRCDVAGMIPVGFWNKAVPEIKKVKHVFMLAEWETPEMHDTAFDMTYSWDLYKAMNQIAKGEKTADYIDTVLAKEDTTYPRDAYRMRFTSNHDENSWNGTEYQRLGPGAKCFAALDFVLPGMPLIYSGQEAAFDHALRFFDKDTIQWDSYPLEGFYTALIKLKREHKALWNGLEGGALLPLDTGHGKEVYACLRKNGDDRVIGVFNLTGHPVSVPVSGPDINGRFRDAFTGTIVNVREGMVFNLGPWDYRVLAVD